MFITYGYIIAAYFAVSIAYHLAKFSYEKEGTPGLVGTIVAVTLHGWFIYWVYTATTLLK